MQLSDESHFGAKAHTIHLSLKYTHPCLPIVGLHVCMHRREVILGGQMCAHIHTYAHTHTRTHTHTHTHTHTQASKHAHASTSTIYQTFKHWHASNPQEPRAIHPMDKTCGCFPFFGCIVQEALCEGWVHGDLGEGFMEIWVKGVWRFG